jgi:hypothetical protein
VINVDGTRQVETKNKINVQESTYPATAARNSVTIHDDSNTGERDIPEFSLPNCSCKRN